MFPVGVTHGLIAVDVGAPLPLHPVHTPTVGVRIIGSFVVSYRHVVIINQHPSCCCAVGCHMSLMTTAWLWSDCLLDFGSLGSVF